MAIQLEPSGEKVFDPFMGEERDAFPGEVVPPEQEKTMQRLMREGEEEFLEIYNAVKDTGEMSEDEMLAVRKAGKVYAEIRRREYLEQIKSNPAVILRTVFEKLSKDSEAVKKGLESLEVYISEIRSAVENRRSADTVAGKSPLTNIEYIRSFYGDTSRTILDTYYKILGSSDYGRILTPSIGLRVLNELEASPVENAESLDRVKQVIRTANNVSGSGRPYIQNESVFDLPARKPGLEGLTVSLIYYQSLSTKNITFQGIVIKASPEVLVRIIEAEDTLK